MKKPMGKSRGKKVKGLVDEYNITIVITLIVLYIVSTKNKISSDVFVSIIALIQLFTGTITMLKTSTKEEKYIDCLAMGLIVMAIGTIISTNFIKSSIGFWTYMTYEMLIIPFSVVLYRAFNNKIEYFLMHFSILGAIMFYKYVESNAANLLEGDYFGFKNSFFSITIIVVLSLIIMCLVKENSFNKYKKTVAMVTVGLWVVNLVSMVEQNVGLKGLNSFFIIKVIVYIYLYRQIEQTFLVNAYDEAKNNCEEGLRVKSLLNHNLIEREKELTEINNTILKSEKRYEELIESISDGIIIFKDGNVDYINGQGIYLLIKNTKKDIMQLSLENILELFSIDWVSLKELKKGVIRKCEIRDFDDSIIFLEIILVNTTGNNFILLLKNITEEVNLNEVREKYTQEKTMFDVKSKFYSNVSHELRTPINVISSAIQLNEVFIENNQLNNLGNSNKVIKQNCLRLIRTINNFMDTNRITEGFLEANIQVHNIVSIIENVALASNKYIKMKNMNLVIDPEVEELYVACDKQHLERIMLNILSNTIKYGTSHGEIYIGITIEEDGAKVMVRNNNTPISKDDFDKVFEDFQKLDDTFSRNTEGSGLGLFLTKELVSLNNGRIEINSSEVDGNTFIIVLPFSYNGEEWVIEENYGINEMEEKVDIEFADIYF